jgi:nitrate/nitrite transport system ATP-binding protein
LAFIEVRKISKTFVASGVPRPVLHEVTVSVERGEFVSVVGTMGCGKSTFLNVVAGLMPPDAGEVLVEGAPLRGVRKDAAIVFQNYSLLPWFSALENVRLAVGAAFPHWSRAQQKSQAERFLAMVGLSTAMNRRPTQLSGGMRQRVAIARAFAIEPELLFLDEPFGALDALTRATLQQELARMCSEQGRPVTVVMITNSVEEAILLSDRIVPMTRGPRAKLGDAITVALPRPRTVSQLLHDEAAERVRAYVVESLTDGVYLSGRVRRETVRMPRPAAGSARFQAVAPATAVEND